MWSQSDPKMWSQNVRFWCDPKVRTKHLYLKVFLFVCMCPLPTVYHKFIVISIPIILNPWSYFFLRSKKRSGLAHLLKWDRTIPDLIFLYFRRFNNSRKIGLFIIKYCRWMDSNHRPLVSETTETQPLPLIIGRFPLARLVLISFISKSVSKRLGAVWPDLLKSHWSLFKGFLVFGKNFNPMWHF